VKDLFNLMYKWFYLLHRLFERAYLFKLSDYHYYMDGTQKESHHRTIPSRQHIIMKAMVNYKIITVN